MDIEPAIGLHRTVGIRHGDDAVPVGSQLPGDVLAGVAEALDGDPHRLAQPEIARQMAHEIVTAARGRVAAPQRAAQSARLAGVDGRPRLSARYGPLDGPRPPQ